MRTPTITIGALLVSTLMISGCGNDKPQATHASGSPADKPTKATSTTTTSTTASTGSGASEKISTQSTSKESSPAEVKKQPKAKGPQRTTRRRPIQVDKVAKVLLSEGHQKMCLVKVGDSIPAIGLPDTNGNLVELRTLYGSRLTVLVFWKGDRALARWELADLGPDVMAPFAAQGVNVVGVAVEMDEAAAVKQLKAAGANFPNLLDEEGTAFAKVGSGRLPRTYLLDPDGKILWFDIEYSSSTRKELLAAIRYIVKQK